MGGKCGPQTNNCGQSVQCLTLADGACATDSACCSGVCVDGICQAGPVAAGGACDNNSDCASGHCCGSTCRDLTSDPDHSGGCDTICSSNNMATRTCSSGICNGTCAAGFDDCNGNKLADGCETNLSDDVSHCGACGTVCSTANGTPVCVNSACAIGSCNEGFADCNALASDGCETNTVTDASHCGGCGNQCATGASCQGGQCVCPTGQKLCGDACIANDLCCTNADCDDGNLCTTDTCDPSTHMCSHPAVVCPYDGTHKGNPCYTTICTDPAIGCQTVPVPDGTHTPACDFDPSTDYCYGGSCCTAGPGNYYCLVDSGCCPGYHCVCRYNDPVYGCRETTGGQCLACKHAGDACTQDHECCSDSCVSGACVGG